MRETRWVTVCGLLLAACGGGGAEAGDDGETGDTSGGSSSAAADASSSAGEPTGTDDTGVPAVAGWHEVIAPIVVGKCGGCHVDGGIAPFGLWTYAQAAPFAPAMLDAIDRRTMPPFLADETDECAPRFGWQDDPRLTADERAAFTAWVEAGAPEGDPARAAPLPTPPDLTLQDADMDLGIETEVTIDGNQDQFLCFSVDPGFTEDTWIDALQISAGNSRIVHHVLVYLDEQAESADKVGPDGYYPCFGGPGINDSGLIGAWAPGSVPFVMPPDTAMRITAGSRIVLNVHYHPTGQPEQDSATGIQMRRYDAALPTYVGLLALVGNSESAGEGLLPGPGDDGAPVFKIPAGASGHTEEMVFDSDSGLPELRIFGVSTHMHYVGTDMRMGLQRNTPVDGAPDEECLLQTPRWNFNWQRIYKYDADLDELPIVHSGDGLHLRCTYDNTMANPFVAQALAQQGLDAPQDVVLGESTLDEMCLGVFAVAIKLEDLI